RVCQHGAPLGVSARAPVRRQGAARGGRQPGPGQRQGRDPARLRAVRREAGCCGSLHGPLEGVGGRQWRRGFEFGRWQRRGRGRRDKGGAGGREEL
ncbi:hypothetical protein BN1723_020705, partial [Verticillium longisporum]